MKVGLVMVGQPAIPNNAGRLSCTGAVGGCLPFFLILCSPVLVHPYLLPASSCTSFLTRLPTFYNQASVNLLQ
jgi:hypothetical protein